MINMKDVKIEKNIIIKKIIIFVVLLYLKLINEMFWFSLCVFRIFIIKVYKLVEDVEVGFLIVKNLVIVLFW